MQTVLEQESQRVGEAKRLPFPSVFHTVPLPTTRYGWGYFSPQ